MSEHASLIEFRNISRGRAYTLGAWFLATIILGTWGYLDYSTAAGHPITPLTAVYHTGQLFMLHAPHFEGHINLMLEVARWSAAAFTARAVFGLGRHLLRRERTTWRLRRLNQHVIVCGLGRRGVDCVRAERNKPVSSRRDVVVIDRAPPADLVEECASLGAHVLTGDATDPNVLGQAGVARASVLYALLGDDGMNCTVATQAREVLAMPGPRHEPLVCSVQLSNLELRSTLEEHIHGAVDGSRITLRFFDLFDVEARRILLTELPIDHDGVRYDESRRVHLVILGFGRMGRAVAVRAAKLGHFVNATRDRALRLKISVIDRAAKEVAHIVLSRYPQFQSCCEFEVHEHEIDSPAAKSKVEAWCTDPTTICSVAVCFDDEARAAAVAIGLIPLMQRSGTRVALRLARRTGLGSVMEMARKGAIPSARIQPFGMIEDGSSAEAFAVDDRERLAQAIHAAFVRDNKATRPKDDPAMLPWRQLGEVLRESNRQQEDHIPIKLRAIGCEKATTGDPRPAVTAFSREVAPGVTEEEVLARMEHDRWNAERWLAGWTYADGPKSVERRTSPYLVPWSDLPDKVKGFDLAAVRLIPKLLSSVGMKACRK